CSVRDITDQLHEEQGAQQEQDDLAATITALRAGDRSTHDPLTGLVNPCYLEESLPRELHRAQRSRLPLTVALLDVDRFSRINEAFGRDAGDAVLLELSRVLREHLRKSDMACRFADDEFVLVLPQSAPAATVERVEQIRRAVRDRALRHGDRQLNRVTISAGIALAGEHTPSTRELLGAARAALATAKREGGDRVAVHSVTAPLHHA
ncbi:MAG: GGDEF domain-containing protein, partial [Gemmatimonadales bacterium]